jgi:phosphoribosyl-AMP cyclohydrolase
LELTEFELVFVMVSEFVLGVGMERVLEVGMVMGLEEVVMGMVLEVGMEMGLEEVGMGMVLEVVKEMVLEEVVLEFVLIVEMERVLEEAVMGLVEVVLELESEVAVLTMVLEVAWFALKEVRKTLTKTMEEFESLKSRRLWEGLPWRC